MGWCTVWIVDPFGNIFHKSNPENRQGKNNHLTKALFFIKKFQIVKNVRFWACGSTSAPRGSQQCATPQLTLKLLTVMLCTSQNNKMQKWPTVNAAKPIKLLKLCKISLNMEKLTSYNTVSGNQSLRWGWEEWNNLFLLWDSHFCI